jgi:hypothetical protein
MKNLLPLEVKKIFEDSGCVLLDEYNKSNISMSYICKCGERGIITLDEFRRRLKTNGGCKSCKDYKLWSKEEDDCLKSLYGKVPRQQILDCLCDKNYNDLKNRAYKLGLQGNRSFVQSQARKGKGRKHQINFIFFDVVDSLRSYWAGFIAANGNINEDRKRLVIGSDRKDKLHLESFKEAVEYTGETSCSGSQVSLQFHGVENWLEKLSKNYCLTARKHLTLQPPVELDEENSLSFIIGYIDGKGCSIHADKEFSIYLTGTNDMMCWIKTWFDIWCPSIQRRSASVILDKKGHYRYTVSGKRADYLLRKMKRTSVPKLVRKWKQVRLDSPVVNF